MDGGREMEAENVLKEAPKVGNEISRSARGSDDRGVVVEESSNSDGEAEQSEGTDMQLAEGNRRAASHKYSLRTLPEKKKLKKNRGADGTHP